MSFAGGIGKAVGAFGDTEMEQQFYSEALNNALNKEVTESIPGLKSTASRDFDLFDKGIETAINRINNQGDRDLSDINALLNTTRSFDPGASTDRVRSGNLSALDSFIRSLSGAGSAADKAALARLGYGSRPASSLQNRVQQSYLASTAAPALNTIFSNLGRDAALQNEAYFGNFGNQIGLINERGDIPRRALDLYLQPLSARYDAQGRDLGFYDQAGNTIRSNSAGWMARPDTLARIGTAFEGLGESEDAIVDYALTYYTGGLNKAAGLSASGEK